MKKRITIICSSYPPEKGAAPSRIYHLANLLQQAGNEVMVITAMPNYPTGKIFPDFRNKIIHSETVNGIRIYRTWLLPTNSSNKIKRIISTCSYSISLLCLALPKLIISKPQLIIISSPPFITGYLGTLFTKCTQAKILLNISDLWPRSALDLGFVNDGWFYKLLLKMEQKMYQKADFYSVQSEEIKDHIASTQNNKSIFVYRNLQPNSDFAHLPRPVGKRKIIYAGLLGIAQGVFEIVSQIDFGTLGTELHIYGQGFQLEKIKKWIADNPNASIYYHGSVTAEDIPQILSLYHAMLIPLSSNIHGAVPSKIFNSIANGLPILFCGQGEAAAIVRQNNIGFVADAGDLQMLTQNLKKILSMSEVDYEILRSNCIRLSGAKFNKTKQEDEFLLFLETNAK